MAPTRSPNRTVRVAHPLWHSARAEAKRRGEKISDAIRSFLERYVEGER